MRGETTIQLFDANTGELTGEVTKHNLITGAATDFLQILAYASTFNGNGSIYNLLNNGLDNTHDTIRELYGGVLIFSEPIDESHKYPIVSEILTNIGHAGQTASFYDSEDTYAGQFNAVESEFNVENKRYKFVWDFPTSACNGDIASICLTNKMVGDRGLLRNIDKLIPSGHSIYDVVADTGYDRYSRDNSSVYPYLREAEFNPKNGIGLDGNKKYDSSVRYTSIIPDFSSITSGYTCIYLYNYNDYRFIATKYSDSSKILDLRLINKDGTYDDYTYDFTNFISMLSSEGLSFSSSNIGNFVSNSFSLSDMCFYICTVSWIAKFNITSRTYNFARLTEVPAKQHLVVFRYMDIPFCLVNYTISSDKIASSITRIINDDLSLGNKCIPLPNKYMYERSSRYYLDRWTSSHSDDYSYHLIGDNAHPNACYLATINNQSDILTKTPDKTMKIIYTLYEE